MAEKKAKVKESNTQPLLKEDTKRIRQEKFEKVKHTLLLILLVVFGSILLIEVILPKIF